MLGLIPANIDNRTACRLHSRGDHARKPQRGQYVNLPQQAELLVEAQVGWRTSEHVGARVVYPNVHLAVPFPRSLDECLVCIYIGQVA